MVAEQSTNKKTRRLRTTAPTVREQAGLAQNKSDKPSRSQRSASRIGRFFARIGRGLRKAFRPLRFLRKPLRLLAIGLGLRYVISSWRELRQVTWPNRTQTRRLTTAVLIFSVIFGVLIAAVDYVLDKVFKALLAS